MRYKKLDTKVPDLKKYSEEAAGYDLCTTSDISPTDHSDICIYTGVAIEIPRGYVGLLTLRSSAGQYLSMPEGVGIIDSDYRGHITLNVTPKKGMPVNIKAYERVAQLVVLPCSMEVIEEVKELRASKRGSNRFGSTGK